MLDQYAFPMAPASGLFIAVVGICVAVGGFSAVLRKPLLVLGAVMATVALVTVGPHLQTGRPTAMQLWFLFGSIALEGVLVRAAFYLYRDKGERRVLLAVLLAVGLHFIPMAVAFGPLCLVLALVCSANALRGTYIFRQAAVGRVWAADGLLKVALGFCMMAKAVA
jgi:hypothetical protein